MKLTARVIPIFSLVTITAVFLIMGSFFSWYSYGISLYGSVILYCASLLFLIFGYSIVILRLDNSRLVFRKPVSDAFNYFVIIVSIIAVISLFYDRYFLRGIDYFADGIAASRAQINSSTVSGSLFSFFGNLFSYAFLIPLINLFYDWEFKSKRYRKYMFSSCILIMLVFSSLMGGRTVILIALSFLVSCAIGRRVCGKSYLPREISLTKVFLFCLFALFLVASIFYLRALAFNSGEASTYVKSVCQHLSAAYKVDNIDCSIRVHGVDTDSLTYVKAVFLYIYHVLWASESIVQIGGNDASILLAGIDNLVFSRIGFYIDKHSYAGFFVPGGASVYHDLGSIGVIGVFVLTGMLLAIFLYFQSKGRVWLGRFGFVYLFSACLLSLMISPANIPGFILTGVCILIFSFISIFFNSISSFNSAKA